MCFGKLFFFFPDYSRLKVGNSWPNEGILFTTIGSRPSWPHVYVCMSSRAAKMAANQFYCQLQTFGFLCHVQYSHFFWLFDKIPLPLARSFYIL